MHFVFIAIKVLAQAAFAAFVPGGGVLVALNLYRKYRAKQAKTRQAQALAAQATVTASSDRTKA